jgi:hypothetical protein
MRQAETRASVLRSQMGLEVIVASGSIGLQGVYFTPGKKKGITRMMFAMGFRDGKYRVQSFQFSISDPTTLSSIAQKLLMYIALIGLNPGKNEMPCCPFDKAQQHLKRKKDEVMEGVTN